MKTAPVVDGPAFPDPKLTPDHAGLMEVVGHTVALALEKIDTWLREAHPEVTTVWKYMPRVGWYEIRMLRQRRIFYLLPKRGDCRLNLVLGDKAILSLGATEHATQVINLLKTVKRYPEGTVFSFDRHSIKAGLIIALIEAKLTH